MLPLDLKQERIFRAKEQSGYYILIIGSAFFGLALYHATSIYILGVSIGLIFILMSQIKRKT